MTMRHETRMRRAAEYAALEPLLIHHLHHLQERNLRPRSVEQRRDAVLRSARWLGHPLATVTEIELKRLQTALSQHRTPAGVKGEVVQIAQYLKWLLDEDYRKDDPSRVLVRPRLDARLPRPMSDSDVRRAMDAADYPLRAWIALAAFCGLRCMEIAGLRGEDIIRSSRAFLRISGKGGKERVVPCPQVVLDLIAAAGAPATGLLWARLDGSPGRVEANRVSQMINVHLHGMGIAHTAHTLRHRFGTKLYAETKDLMLVAETMGHSSMQTTRLYVKLNPSAAQDPVDVISQLAD
jgi:integrase/recombinase XerC